MELKIFNMRNLDLEKQIFTYIFEDFTDENLKEIYDGLMNLISKDQTRYSLILNILKNMKIYNDKVGIKKDIKITNIKAIVYKSTYNLQEINHKWIKLSNNPDIEPSEIFKDF